MRSVPGNPSLNYTFILIHDQYALMWQLNRSICHSQHSRVNVSAYTSLTQHVCELTTTHRSVRQPGYIVLSRNWNILILTSLSIVHNCLNLEWKSKLRLAISIATSLIMIRFRTLSKSSGLFPNYYSVYQQWQWWAKNWLFQQIGSISKTRIYRSLIISYDEGKHNKNFVITIVF